MRPILFVLLGAVLLAAPDYARAAPTNGVQSETEQFADLGSVEILHSGSAADDLLLLLDDSAGGGRELARQLAQQGHWVAYIKSQHLFENALKNRDACVDATTLLDVFSQHLQEKYRFPHYQKPVLIGYRQAAALAYATVAQAPQRLFAGAIGIDFCPTLLQPVPPCQNSALRWQRDAAKHYRLQPAAALPAAWMQLDTGHADCPVQDRAAFADETTLAAATLSSHIDSWLAATSKPAATNIARPNIDTAVPTNGAPTTGISAIKTPVIDDLPLVELPTAKTDGDIFVVLLSGDGGWADIDKDIGGALNAQGLPVVGWNSLQYFWNRKTPQSASADLQRVIRHYSQLWHKNRVLLIGFSLGADVLPFMISRLPNTERERIADIALLSLSHSVDFEFHVSAWLGSSKGDTHQIAPELKKITKPVLCVYGSADDDTLCKDFKAPNVANTVLPGDHHYQGDFQAVTKLILAHSRKSDSKQ